MPDPIANPQTRSQYIMHSLFQEAVTSSQLEGAATTRAAAKEMLCGQVVLRGRAGNG